MKIFCVIPAWNEAKHIGQVVSQVKPVVDEVIVVNDCSTDQTPELARAAGATVLNHIVNRYQGAALRTGTHYAVARSQDDRDIIVHFDADGQMRAQDIAVVIEPLQKNLADVSFGSRFLNNTTRMPAFKKKVIMPLARLINRFMGIKLTDPQSGFRAMTVGVARQLKLEQDGMAHCSEILAEVHALKFRITEVPITVIYHEFGQNFWGGFKIIKDIIINKLIN